MKKDIKKLITDNYTNSTKDLPKNHRDRFEARLKKELHAKPQNKFNFLKIAAVILLVIGFSFMYKNSTSQKEEPKQNYTLGSLSPELKKIEDYYTNAINFELSKIEINNSNKAILEQYFSKLEQLTLQYEKESAQISIDTINEKSINALIDNLQIRLQLLLQLKEELTIIKNPQNEKKSL